MAVGGKALRTCPFVCAEMSILLNGANLKEEALKNEEQESHGWSLSRFFTHRAYWETTALGIIKNQVSQAIKHLQISNRKILSFAHVPELLMSRLRWHGQLSKDLNDFNGVTAKINQEYMFIVCVLDMSGAEELWKQITSHSCIRVVLQCHFFKKNRSLAGQERTAARRAGVGFAHCSSWILKQSQDENRILDAPLSFIATDVSTHMTIFICEYLLYIPTKNAVYLSTYTHMQLLHRASIELKLSARRTGPQMVCVLIVCKKP